MSDLEKQVYVVENIGEVEYTEQTDSTITNLPQTDTILLNSPHKVIQITNVVPNESVANIPNIAEYLMMNFAESNSSDTIVICSRIIGDDVKNEDIQKLVNVTNGIMRQYGFEDITNWLGSFTAEHKHLGYIFNNTAGSMVTQSIYAKANLASMVANITTEEATTIYMNMLASGLVDVKEDRDVYEQTLIDIINKVSHILDSSVNKTNEVE